MRFTPIFDKNAIMSGDAFFAVADVIMMNIEPPCCRCCVRISMSDCWNVSRADGMTMISSGEMSDRLSTLDTSNLNESIRPSTLNSYSSDCYSYFGDYRKTTFGLACSAIEFENVKWDFGIIAFNMYAAWAGNIVVLCGIHDCS